MIQKKDQIILLVEDNTDDIELTLRAFDKSNIMNEVIVVRDGQEALDYLFVTGAHCGRDPMVMPHVVLLDLNLPKLDGLGVLRRIRADERTKLLPVVILTTSREEADIIALAENHDTGYEHRPRRRHSPAIWTGGRTGIRRRRNFRVVCK